MRLYISGAGNAEKFKRAEEWLKLNDYSAVNPMVLQEIPLSGRERMQLGQELVRMCDGIYMLKGWQKDKGACAELAYAKTLGKTVKYEDAQKSFRKSVAILEQERKALDVDTVR